MQKYARGKYWITSSMIVRLMRGTWEDKKKVTNVSGRIGFVRFLRGLKSASEGQDIDKEHLETHETYIWTGYVVLNITRYLSAY